MTAKLCPKSAAIAFAAVMACRLLAQDQRILPPLPSYLTPNYDESGRKLPPGVPRVVNTNGIVVSVPHRFTTRAYRNEAIKLVTQEANQVALELNLQEKLPITESNSKPYISPFGFAYAYRMIGTVTTKNYIYYVSRGDRFSGLGETHQLEHCQEYLANYTWPIDRIDTNAAYQLATQWLAAVHMDVKRLDRDCRVSVAVDNAYVQAPPGKFVPIYFVSWIPSDGIGDVASVRLFAPTKTLMDLSVEDPKYILRQPLVFTNLAALFPGKATVSTNYPMKTISVPAPPP